MVEIYLKEYLGKFSGRDVIWYDITLYDMILCTKKNISEQYTKHRREKSQGNVPFVGAGHGCD